MSNKYINPLLKELLLFSLYDNVSKRSKNNSL